MPRKFIDIVKSRDSIAELLDERDPPHSDAVIAALLLDASGMKPDDLDKGVHVIRCPDKLLTVALADVIADAVKPRRTRDISNRKGLATGDVALLFSSDDSSHAGELTAEAMRKGCSVVKIVTMLDGDVLVDVADHVWVLQEAASPVLISDAIEAMTGDRIDSVNFKDAVNFGDLLLCLHPDSAAESMAAKVCKMINRYAKKVADLTQERDDAQSLGDAAAAVVTRLRDLSGYGAAKDWGMRLAADLRAYKQGELAWQDVDRGILLSGPPGSGKTYFARALAAECDVPLIVSGYSEWESGAGGNLIAKAIKKSFADARKRAPCIVFIDEIDTVGSREIRTHNSSWFDAVINALLAELDGPEPRPGVICIGATNHPEAIDPALLRPGRLDRHVAIPKPTIADLRGVIIYQLGAGAVEDGLDQAARACRGKTPADIAQIAREARRIARMCKRNVCAGDVSDVVWMTREQRIPALDRHFAVHESGHALTAHLLGTPLDSVDIDAGLTSVSKLDASATRAEIEQFIAVLLAGRIATDILDAGASSGASDDLEKATDLAFQIVSRFGMGDSLMALPAEVAIRDGAARRQVEAILAKADADVRGLLTKHRAALERLVAELLDKRYLDGAEVAAVVEPKQDKNRNLS
jgi:hypothetical protein